jgi:hypothetical protein
MENNLLCHIIGFNIKNKKTFIESIDKKFFNVIDLDEINNEILNDSQLDKLFRQYIKLKESKNDKFKDVDKKMTLFWETEFYNKIISLISSKKKNIFIGLNTHYKNTSKKINLETLNNFIINSDNDEDIKILIEYNLEQNKENIIKGKYPLEYIDYNFLMKKKENLINTFKKNGYIEKSYDEIIELLMLMVSEDDNKENGLWISLKEPYNINSKIHPAKNDILTAYSEPTIALLDSFNFKDDELERTFTNDSTLSIKEITPNVLEKLKKKRFLYYVEKNPFLPYKNSKSKYFTQSSVLIKGKEKINNVYEYLIDK